MPRLTDFKARYSHKYYQTNTVTTIEKQKPQKRSIITIRPEVTGGYDIINKQWGIMVGIGVGINF